MHKVETAGHAGTVVPSESATCSEAADGRAAIGGAPELRLGRWSQNQAACRPGDPRHTGRGRDARSSLGSGANKEERAKH